MELQNRQVTLNNLRREHGLKLGFWEWCSHRTPALARQGIGGAWANEPLPIFPGPAPPGEHGLDNCGWLGKGTQRGG